MRLDAEDVRRIYDGDNRWVEDPMPPTRTGWDWPKVGAWAVMLGMGGGALYFAAAVVVWAVRVVAR